MTLVVTESVLSTEAGAGSARPEISGARIGVAWCSLNAIDGISLAGGVMGDLSDARYTRPFLRPAGLDECPIVNTPVDKIKDNLRMLVENPKLRRELGEAGRRYVLKFHSYGAVGRMWEAIYRKVWYGEDIDLAVWHTDRAIGSKRV